MFPFRKTHWENFLETKYLMTTLFSLEYMRLGLFCILELLKGSNNGPETWKTCTNNEA